MVKYRIEVMKPIQRSSLVFWLCIWTVQFIVFGTTASVSLTILPASGSSPTTTTTIRSLEAISSLSSTISERSSENVVAIDLKAVRLHEEDVATLTTLLLHQGQHHISRSIGDSTNAVGASRSTSIQSLSMKECVLSRKHMISLLSSALLKGSQVETLSIHNRYLLPPPSSSIGYCLLSD